MTNVDLVTTLVLFTIIALAAVVYSLRVMIRGRVHFDRVEKQGGSALLSKFVMEAGYWFMQPLARLLVFLHITPNQLSWASFGFGFAAGVALVFGHFGSAGVFSAICSILDSLDGLVARMTGKSSDAGEVLDATVDRYVEFFFMAGLIVYYREMPSLIVLTLLAMIGSFMVSYSSAKAEALQVSPPKGPMRRPERAVYLTLGAALCPVTIPIFEQIRETPVAIGHPMVIALGLVAVLANVSAVERMWAIAKAMRVREAEAAAARLAALRASTEKSTSGAGVLEDGEHPDPEPAPAKAR